MKSIVTLLFVLIFGATALANININDKVNGLEVDFILVDNVNYTNDTSKIEINFENQTARLYKFQNARITKALEFDTKKTAAKLV